MRKYNENQKTAEQQLTKEEERDFGLEMAGLPLQAHPDHTCQLTDIQCILQYIALAQDVSVLTLGLQSLQALCQCTGASSQGYGFFF